jgi:hypothetical protein
MNNFSIIIIIIIILPNFWKNFCYMCQKFYKNKNLQGFNY